MAWHRHRLHDRRARTARAVLAFRAGLASAVVASATGAQAQQSPHDPEAFVNQQRAVDERLRRTFDEEVGARQRTLFDWGGWYNLHLFLFDDGVASSRTFRRHDVRLWGRVVLDKGAHEFYVRTRHSLLDFNSSDAYDGNDDDIEGPNLERGYYRFDLRKALHARAGGQEEPGAPPDYDLVATFGRDLVQFGTGLTLAAPLDHVAVTLQTRGFALTALAGRTIGSAQDVDLSRSAKRTRRTFLGGELKYVAGERHEPFIYALWQRDHNREAFWRPLQAFNYDSFYFGVGSVGELAKGLHYVAEGVFETGRSFFEQRFLHANRVEAWSMLAGLEYLAPGPRKARVSAEYLFGSGEAARVASPTNTLGAHRGGHDDAGFVGFGYRDTGLVLAPRHTNLHMWRAGASFFPYPKHPRLSRLEIGSDWYLFHKHHASAALSDPTAAVRSGYVGWEMDYFANWKVTSDLSWTARFGAFFPGKAYRDRTTRTFFLMGITWSF